MSADAEGVEFALVGALLLSPEEYPSVAAVVKPADIRNARARKVFEVIRFLAGGGTPIDPVLVRSELERQGELDEVGGSTGLADFVNAPTSGAHAGHYAESVARNARERRIRDAIRKADMDIDSGEMAVEEVCATLRADLKEAEAGDAGKLRAESLFEITMRQLDPDMRRDLVATGYPLLDVCHGGGIARGSLTIVGAAPSIGKTQFVINLTPALEYQGKPARVLYVSMEMGESEMSQRLVAMMSGLNIHTTKAFFQLTASKYTRDEYGPKFEAGLHAIQGLPVRMVSGSFTADELRSIAYRHAGMFDVMIVDYLQRCKGEKGQSTRDRVETATRACKDIAMDNDAAVIAIASLNRDGYKDGASRPDMQHLRESGNIEFDADNIWMLWRKKDSSVNTEDMELYIRKQRNGPLSTILYEFELPTGVISEKSQDQQPNF